MQWSCHWDDIAITIITTTIQIPHFRANLKEYAPKTQIHTALQSCNNLEEQLMSYSTGVTTVGFHSFLLSDNNKQGAGKSCFKCNSRGWVNSDCWHETTGFQATSQNNNLGPHLCCVPKILCPICQTYEQTRSIYVLKLAQLKTMSFNTFYRKLMPVQCQLMKDILVSSVGSIQICI